MDEIMNILATISYHKITQREIARRVERSDRTVRTWLAEPTKHADKMKMVGDAVEAILAERER